MSEMKAPRFLGRHVMMKWKHAEALLNGRKRATIRLGIVRPKFREVLLHSGGRVVAKLAIKEVYYKKFEELGEREAELEGYPSVDELKEELIRIYGRIRPKTTMTVIVFNVVRRLDQDSGRDPWMGLDPVDIARIALRVNLPLSEREEKVLRTLIQTSSLRKTASSLYGSVEERIKVRKILRGVLKRLIERGVIGRRLKAMKD